MRRTRRGPGAGRRREQVAVGHLTQHQQRIAGLTGLLQRLGFGGALLRKVLPASAATRSNEGITALWGYETARPPARFTRRRLKIKGI